MTSSPYLTSCFGFSELALSCSSSIGDSVPSDLFTMSEAVLNSLDAIVGFETHKSTHWEYHWSRLAGRITRAESCLRDSMIGGTTPPGCTLTRHGRLRCTGQSRRGRARGLPNKCTACEESATRDGAPKNVRFTV
jgi:hypothetical protein